MVFISHSVSVQHRTVGEGAGGSCGGSMCPGGCEGKDPQKD